MPKLTNNQINEALDENNETINENKKKSLEDLKKLLEKYGNYSEENIIHDFLRKWISEKTHYHQTETNYSIEKILKRREEDNCHIPQKTKKRIFQPKDASEIPTKFLIQELSEDLDFQPINFHRVIRKIEVLIDRNEESVINSENFENILERISGKLLQKIEDNRKNSDIIDFMIIINSLKISEKINKKLFNFVKTQNNLKIESLNKLIKYIKKESQNLEETKFIDFITKNIIYQKNDFRVNDFIEILENFKDWLELVFLKSLLKNIYILKKETDLNLKTFIFILNEFKDCELERLTRVERNIIFDVFRKNYYKIWSNEISKFIYWLVKLKNIPDEILKISFKIIENDKSFSWKSIIELLISFQNKEENSINDKYFKIMNEKISSSQNSISIRTARSLLYFSKYLQKDIISEENIEILFKIIESDFFKFEKKLDDENDKEFKGIEAYKARMVILIFQIYNMYNRKIPLKFLEIYEKIKHTQKINHNFEKFIYSKIVEIYPKSEIYCFIDWFLLGIYIPELNLDIEIDWTAHEKWVQIVKDKIRDRYLEEQKWIRVQRMKIWEQDQEKELGNLFNLLVSENKNKINRLIDVLDFKKRT